MMAILFIEALVDDLDDVSQLIEDKKAGGRIELSSCGDYGDIPTNIEEFRPRADVRGIEAHRIFVGRENAGARDAEDGSEENVGVEHQAFLFCHRFWPARKH